MKTIEVFVKEDDFGALMDGSFPNGSLAIFTDQPHAEGSLFKVTARLYLRDGAIRGGPSVLVEGVYARHPQRPSVNTVGEVLLTSNLIVRMWLR